jgi:hypothetical protein
MISQQNHLLPALSNKLLSMVDNYDRRIYRTKSHDFINDIMIVFFFYIYRKKILFYPVVLGFSEV